MAVWDPKHDVVQQFIEQIQFKAGTIISNPGRCAATTSKTGRRCTKLRTGPLSWTCYFHDGVSPHRLYLWDQHGHRVASKNGMEQKLAQTTQELLLTLRERLADGS